MASVQLLASYSPEEVAMVIYNDMFSHTITGTADGPFLTITRVVPHATLYTGADASNARVVRRIKNCDITVTLMQTSESNDILSQLLLRDEESRDGRDTFSIIIKDTIGRTVASAPSAFIGTSPDISFGVEVDERDWVLHAIGMNIFEGGNAKITPSTFSTLEDLGYTPDERWRTR